jgi:MoaA/NifB/PqqE/SkfB family radical SAM enzyme
MNLTLSVSYKCNSGCKTCNIHRRSTADLSLEEWNRILTNIGTAPFWTTISGGEPFLRRDLTTLVCSLYDHCSPSIINIPTNGILTERIPEMVRGIAQYCKKAQVVLNVSIDGIEEQHDEIRGVPGSYQKAIQTFLALKALKVSNLSVGIHTVISRFNVGNVAGIYERLHQFGPDSYITEIAEEREELCTMGSVITPSPKEYGEAVDFLAKALKRDHFEGIGRITRAFRIEYYEMVKKILAEKRQIIPCYAGFASAQIAPGGDVWMCCIKAESIGNLREHDYDFRRVWFSDKAESIRQDIRDGKCYCPLANAGYTNMLHDPPTLLRVMRSLIRFN